MALVRGSTATPRAAAIVAGILGVCRALGIAAVAEGVETKGEMRTLRDLGISLQQGSSSPGRSSAPSLGSPGPMAPRKGPGRPPSRPERTLSSAGRGLSTTGARTSVRTAGARRAQPICPAVAVPDRRPRSAV
jgi:hypothetical protein